MRCKINKAVALGDILTAADRSVAVRKIFDLFDEAEYRIETVFTAVNIMDRYLAKVGFWTFPRDKMSLLATTSFLLAVKLEDLKAALPDVTEGFFEKQELALLTREALLDMEA